MHIVEGDMGCQPMMSAVASLSCSWGTCAMKSKL